MKLSFECYRRQFKRPLKTAQETLAEREGIIITLEKDGRIAQGEVAPWKRFGTESLASAIAFFRSLNGCFSEKQIIPFELPCVRYAVSCALSELHGTWDKMPVAWNTLEIAALFSNEDGFLRMLGNGSNCFKMKIGVQTFALEKQTLESIFEKASPEVKFRLDANMGFDEPTFLSWLRFLVKYRNQIEFLEQPMALGQESKMKAVASDFGIPVALDESVATLENLKEIECKGWDGTIVVKPAFLGDIHEFIEWRKSTHLRLVYSSAFETSIGLGFARRLARTDYKNHYPVGFGTEGLFVD